MFSTIKIHSFVSEITNSSTELFVCNTEKTIEMVKEVLQKIISGYNMMTDGSYSMDVFEEPYIFSLKEFRRWKESEKKSKEKDWNNKFHTIEGWFSDDEDSDSLRNLRIHYIEYGDSRACLISDGSIFQGGIQEASFGKDGEYDYQSRQKEVERIYKEIEKKKTKPDWWKKPWEYHYNSTLVKQLDGCVIITGSDDNSIPYDIWDIINSQLSGSNYHLG